MVSILADLASIARKIAIEKDWVVEICGRDKDMLACKERERERRRERDRETERQRETEREC